MEKDVLKKGLKSKIKINPNDTLDIDYFNKKVQSSSSLFLKMRKGKVQYFYKIGIPLGQGAFGCVRRITHKKTGIVRAMKIVPKSGVEFKLEAARIIGSESSFFREIEILRRLDHPNIMKVFDLFQDKHHYFIISEHCKGGELYDKLMERKQLPEKEVAYIIRQVLSALAYAHNFNIAHRDLKPENIMLDNWDDYPTVKICDWGTAQFMRRDKKISRLYGTPYYVAPEALLCDSYDEKCDVWSVGVILYILLAGYPPFNGTSDKQVAKAVTKGMFSFHGIIWKYISLEAIDLIHKMLSFNPEERPTARSCIRHPWFRIQEDVLYNMNPALTHTALQNIIKFRSGKAFGNSCLAYIVLQLTNKEKSSFLLKLFQAFDVMGDGVIGRDEMVQGFLKFYDEKQLTNSQIDTIMENSDFDQNGFVDYTEFLLSSIDKNCIFTSNNIEIVFALLDKEGSGVISMDNLKEFFETGKDSHESRLKEFLPDSIFQLFPDQLDLNNFKHIIQNAFNS